MGHDIRHLGIVREIGNNYICVAITPQKQECAGCAIAAMCNKPDLVRVPYDKPSPQLIGKNAEISLSYGLHWLSIGLFLAIPVVLLLTAVFVTTFLNCTEAQVACLSLAAVVVWFALLFIFRKHLPSKGIYKVISIS